MLASDLNENKPPATLRTHSPEETESLGRALAEVIPAGSVVALYGELAAGKTCLVRGMAGRFGDPRAVTSPTFTLVQEYGDKPRLYHLDLYRLESLAEIIDLGYDELLDNPDAVCVIEWAERAAPLLPDSRIDIRLEHAGGDARTITIADRGVIGPKLDDALDYWRRMQRHPP